jgi:peptidyl-tRNA hydrolase
MNGSGASVLAASDFYKIEPADILVICDDFALAPRQVAISGERIFRRSKRFG